MADELGNKLKISSIDIIPSNINHNDEYLRVSEDETKYELSSINEVNEDLNISYDKNATTNKGNNKVQDLCLTNFSTMFILSNNSNGYKVTTNGTQLNTNWSVDNMYNCVKLGDWYSAKLDNVWVCVETPVPMAFTEILKGCNYWYADIPSYEVNHFIVEASNDNIDFDILLDYTEDYKFPNRVKSYTFNPEKIKYKYWRLRYPTSESGGSHFRFCFNGEIETNLYTQTEFQKTKLVKLSPLFLQETIPYMTDYTNELGVVSGSSNITEYNTSNKMWQAFRGRVDTNNEGWLSANTQAVPCYLAYTPTEIYDEGLYQFSFRKGIWSNDWGWTAIHMTISLIKEDDSEVVIWDRVMHLIKPATFATEILNIPFKFKQVRWNVIAKYSSHVSMGECQILKYEPSTPVGNLYSNYNIFAINQGNYLEAGGYLHLNKIDYNVSEEEPLEVTFPDKTKKTFTSLDSIEINPQKKFRLITPIWMTSTTYDVNVWNPGLTQDYIDLVDGTCTGVGTQLDASRYYWRAICVDRRTYNDCWLTTNGGAMGGPIYKWTNMKEKGRYIFKFNTGWWGDTNGYAASEVRVHVRNGDNDSWKTVWNVTNIPDNYSTYWWSPVIDIDFEFNQVYFEIVSRHRAHTGLVACAVFQECDYDYQISTTASYNDLYDRAIQSAYDYQESQNLYLRKDGSSYSLSNNVYKQPFEPKEPKENDVWFNNKQEPLTTYQYINGKWEYFNDVLLGNLNLINGFIQTFHDNPYNNNSTYKNTDCIWSSELTLSNEATNRDGDVMMGSMNVTPIVYHNLNIQDVSKYKADCYLKCVSPDLGYEPGDVINIGNIAINDTAYSPATPFLSKNTIGIWISAYQGGWRLAHKYSGQIVNITNIEKWRLVFKIKEL